MGARKLARLAWAALPAALVAACHLDALLNAPGQGAAVARLAFATQPGNTAVDSAFVPPVQVAALDSTGARDSLFAGAVRIAVDSGAAGARLVGPTTAVATRGLATFAGLGVDRAGTGYVLEATDAAGSSVARSAAFDVAPVVAPGPPARLAFVAVPSSAAAGSPLTPAVEVAALDSLGHTATAFKGIVTVALSGSSGGTLTGTSSVAASGGIATFQNLEVDRAGAGYTLVASATGLEQDTSGGFSVAPGPATALGFTGQPSNTAALATIQPPVQVTAFDAFGNPVTSFSGSVHVAIGTDASLLHDATLSGTTTLPAANGVATFGDLSINQPGLGYTLTAAFGTGPPVATSAAFDVSP